MSLPPKTAPRRPPATANPDQSVDGLGGDQSLADVLANALRHAVGGEGSESDQGQGPALATGPGTVSTAGFASAFLAE